MVTGHNSPTAFEESVSAVTATPSVELGSRRWVDGEEYVYVYNGGGQATTGRALLATAVTNYTVAVSSISGGQNFAGYCKHATFTTATYGWLLVKGFVAATTSTQTAMSATDGIGLGDAGALATNTASQNVGIFAMSGIVATGSGSVCNCFIRSIWG